MGKLLLLGLAVTLYLYGRKLRREADPIQRAIDEHLRAEEMARQKVLAQLREEQAADAHSEQVESLLESLGCRLTPEAEASELLSALRCRVHPRAGPRFR